jgi:thiol:disulfide interchange protein DsbC
MEKKWTMFLTFIFATLLLFGITFTLFAGGEKTSKPSTEAVKKELQKTLPRFSISEVNETPIPGIYEIVGETGTIIYYSPKGYLFFGEIWTVDGRSLTAEKRQIIQEKRIAKIIDTLPLDKALKVGNGPKKVIEISDPTCPHCRNVHNSLKDRKDITKYVFFFPIHGEHSLKAIAYIVCSENPAQKYENVYEGKEDSQIEKFEVTSTCQQKVENLLDEHMKVVRTLQVRGTPYFIIGKTPVEGANIPLIEKLLSNK